jgi:cobyrinic acid a,c-diamide synthase
MSEVRANWAGAGGSRGGGTAGQPGVSPPPAEGFVHRSVHASHLHLHWAGQPSIAARLVAAASG